jgi:biotin transport system substrate-specific component
MSQTQTTISAQPVSTARLLRQTVAVLLGSAFVAVCAHISIPLVFTPVPLTLQNFAVLVIGLLLEPAAAFAALVLYLIEGAAGLPVFVPNAPGGFLHLFGPSGGYLLAYPFIAVLAGWLSRRIRPVSFTTLALSAAAASLALYVAGASWFLILTHLSPAATLKMTVLPFLAGDALKVVAAAAIAVTMAKFRKRISNPL